MIVSKNNIAQVFPKTFATEGGYSNRKEDRGGPTHFGITQSTLAEWRCRAVTPEEVQNMSMAEACAIYCAWYYVKPGVNVLPELIQPVVFDMTVNHGAQRATDILQKVLIRLGAHIVNDRSIGKATVEAAKKACEQHPNDIVRFISERREDFYNAIVRNDPTQQENLHGWIDRAREFV